MSTAVLEQEVVSRAVSRLDLQHPSVGEDGAQAHDPLVRVGRDRLDVNPAKHGLREGAHVAGALGPAGRSASPCARAHETPPTDSGMRAQRGGTVEVLQAEGVSELMREDSDLVQVRLVAGEDRLDRVVVDPDRPSVRGSRACDIAGPTRLLERPLVRPDSTKVAVTLGPVRRMHHGEQVHVAIVITRVRDPVGPVVVVPSPVDAGRGHAIEHVENEAQHALSKGPRPGG